MCDLALDLYIGIIFAKVPNLHFASFVFCLFFCKGLDFHDFLRGEGTFAVRGQGFIYLKIES